MISASIVLYNTPLEQIRDAVKSYAPSEDRQLYIIDNSEEIHKEYGFLKEMENVEYIFNNKNIGYGGAHNIGIQKALKNHAEYHIVMNPDISFEPCIIDKMRSYADGHSDVVYILPKVVDTEGELQYLCKRLPTPFDLIFRRFFPSVGPVRKMNDRYILKASGYDRIINPPCLSGCFMFLKVKALENHNLRFDDAFFMYCEDFDLIRRLHCVGKTIYFPDVQIVHAHARESYKSAKMLKAHMKSAILYFNKYGWFWDKERRRMNKRILEELRENIII